MFSLDSMGKFLLFQVFSLKSVILHLFELEIESIDYYLILYNFQHLFLL